MEELNSIEHTGIVQSIDDKHVNVEIMTHPSCTGCMASGICDVSGKDKKVIKALRTLDVKPGDHVMVMMERSMGLRALFLGYLLPFLIVIFLLILLTSLAVTELVAGLSALLSLVPYYLALYLSKEKISKNFSFIIKESD
ncbi:MAG TPA: SoxR reducing system RseC family protein [Bacteroidales bacterium]|nr:SoxR reducing system RseC family protein [Bacteroidales bacterium]